MISAPVANKDARRAPYRAGHWWGYYRACCDICGRHPVDERATRGYVTVPIAWGMTLMVCRGCLVEHRNWLVDVGWRADGGMDANGGQGR